MALAMSSVALQGRVTIVGIGNGSYSWNFYGVPYEVELTSTYWGTIEELHEVAELYRAGKVRPQVELFSLEDGLEAYRRLESGELSGRAVVAPHGH
jgi:propanol-preferring alcohol dehydrogenase